MRLRAVLCSPASITQHRADMVVAVTTIGPAGSRARLRHCSAPELFVRARFRPVGVRIRNQVERDEEGSVLDMPDEDGRAGIARVVVRALCRQAPWSR